MSDEAPFRDPQRLGRLIAALGTWGERNDVPLGVAAMAVGAAIRAGGVKTVMADFGTLVGTFSHFGRVGAGLGASVAVIVGNCCDCG